MQKIVTKENFWLNYYSLTETFLKYLNQGEQDTDFTT